MSLSDLGYYPELTKYSQQNKLDSFEIARVITEHKDLWITKTDEGEYESELIGNLRYIAKDRSDLPVVGDWVAISPYDTEKALIHAVYPRKSMIERQAVGKQGEKQPIASNIDYAFIMQAVDRDFNPNRIERYLAICHTAQVQAIILINKIDLIDPEKLKDLQDTVRERIGEIPFLFISNETKAGFAQVEKLIERGKTYCLLGSSGVGKSTLLNNLLGEEKMQTKSIGEGTNRGKHITTHRELVLLENGGILIDNPGMREVGMVDSGTGIELTFEKINSLAEQCKFNDCTHTSEIGCAVLDAIDRSEIDRSSYENYLKLEREKAHFESTVAEKRKKDKQFGKMVRDVKRIKKLGI